MYGLLAFDSAAVVIYEIAWMHCALNGQRRQNDSRCDYCSIALVLGKKPPSPLAIMAAAAEILIDGAAAGKLIYGAGACFALLCDVSTSLFE